MNDFNRQQVIQILNSGVLAFDCPSFLTLANDDPNGYLTWIYRRIPRPVEVHDDGTATVSFYAPDANVVNVVPVPGKDKDHPIAYSAKKDANGCWVTHLNDIPAGLHHLFWTVDGVETINPMAPVAYGYMRLVNFIDIPTADGAYYEYTDVPHGTVRFELYPSSVTGRCRRCTVYTPAEYEQHPERAYPVIFVQHAGSDTETGAVWQGKFNYILDNLIAEGKAKPMIAVFNSGYAFVDTDERYDSMSPGDLGSVLIRDCLPWLEQRYRILPGPENRGIAGYGMGGFEMMQLIATPNQADKFAYIASMAGPPVSPVDWHSSLADCIPDKERFNREHRLLLFGMETKQPDFLKADFERGISDLRAKGIRLEKFYSPGWHCYQTWRDMIRTVFCKFFR